MKMLSKRLISFLLIISTIYKTDSFSEEFDKFGQFDELDEFDRMEIEKVKQFNEASDLLDSQTKAFDIFDKFDDRLQDTDVNDLDQIISFFEDFSQALNKNYTDEKERDEHIQQFQKSLQHIQSHNNQTSKTYKQGIYEFADLSFDEVHKQKTGLIRESPQEDINLKKSNKISIPSSWDWREYGIVTPARNQGICGCCWAFTAAGALESHNMRKLLIDGKLDRSKLLYVSEQNLMDCSAEKFETLGCDGGKPQMAWKYVAFQGGVNSVQDYPYIEKKGDCNYDEKKKTETMGTYEAVRLNTGASDLELISAIYNYGPVAIAIHTTESMLYYKSGIFDDPACNASLIDHAVLAVGYTPNYFVIKNSYGPHWGEEGFIRLSRSKPNNCGITQQSYYPILPNTTPTYKIKHRFV